MQLLLEKNISSLNLEIFLRFFLCIYKVHLWVYEIDVSKTDVPQLYARQEVVAFLGI